MDYIYLLSAHLYSFIVGDECKKRARVQMCARSVCSCRYNLAGLFDMIKSAYKVLERNIDYYSKKAVGSCGHAAAAHYTFLKKCPACPRRRVGTRDHFFESLR